MTFKKPMLFLVCAPLLALTGCVYDDSDYYDHHRGYYGWDRDHHHHYDARPAGYRDRDRDGVPHRWEGRRGW
jgi:hypothetical protein